MGEEAPFTEEELRAARSQMAMRNLGESITRFVAAWEESLRQEAARFEAARIRAAERAAERQKRIDAAEAWLREQSGVEAQTTFIGPTT